MEAVVHMCPFTVETVVGGLYQQQELASDFMFKVILLIELFIICKDFPIKTLSYSLQKLAQLTNKRKLNVTLLGNVNEVLDVDSFILMTS